jgi:diguanylate cyclase (GGDEF)-like protein/PAS domain S-box-containing protein
MKGEGLADAIWMHAPDAMLVVEATGRIVRINPAGVELFGYQEDELVGQPIEILVPTRHRADHVDKRAHRAEPRRIMGGPSSRQRAVNKRGEEIPVEIALGTWSVDDHDWTIAIVRDVRAREKLEEELRYSSAHDGLTGLYNRAFLDQELARLARSRRFPVAFIVIDLDGLKAVNDHEGHAAGDELIGRTARILSATARGDDVVARVGGDEFVVVLPETALETAHEVLLRLERNAALANEGQALTVRYSAGVAVATEATALPWALRDADERMYAHKRARRGSDSVR